MKTIEIKAMSLLLMLAVSICAHALTEQQQKMLLQMDLMDQMDRVDFLEASNSAKECIRSRDFLCAEKKINQAAKYTNSSRDKAELAKMQQSLINEKKQYAAEVEAARQAKLAEERERARREAAQQKQGEFQFGKFAALATGAAIGGIDKLSSEAQTKIITGMLKDSMPGQEGISNTQNAASTGNTNGNTSNATDEAARNKAIALRCKPIGEAAKPWNDPQVDTFCQLATFDKCLADSGITAYEPERRHACSTLGNLVGGNLSSCSGCR